jgi:putative flippase GtrA
MARAKLEFGFVKRTLLYGAAGLGGVAIDALSFSIIISSYPEIPVSIINLITYSLGTITSFKINKDYAFRSKSHRLSFFRFYLTSIFGMLTSTSILIFLFAANHNMVLSKIGATFVAVFIQYTINSSFSLVSKQSR